MATSDRYNPISYARSEPIAIGATSETSDLRPRSWTPRLAIWVAAIMWIASLFLPVWDTRSDHGNFDVVVGGLPAMIGCLGMLLWCPAWFANIVLLGMAVPMVMGRRASYVVAVGACCIAATAYFMPALYGDNEKADIVGHRIGYYLWLGSFFVILLAHVRREQQYPTSIIWLRIAVLLALILGVFGLEHRFESRLSPFEVALRAPNDVKLLDEVLSRKPSQKEMDVALRWVIQQDNAKPHDEARFQRLRKLLAAGANINGKYEDGTTPLMQAIELSDNDALVELLIRAGANVNATRYGTTVMERAIQLNVSPACRQILEAAGAKVSSEPGTR